MMTVGIHTARTNSVRSDDGTLIAYHSIGHGPGLVVVGSVLAAGSDYMELAKALAAGEFEVHVMERRGRPGSGPQRRDHDLDDECADLAAVTAATGATAVFGHSFGGLVALEMARREPIFNELFVYEPGVPIRGQLQAGWLDEYQRRLERGDRRRRVRLHGQKRWVRTPSGGNHALGVLAARVADHHQGREVEDDGPAPGGQPRRAPASGDT